MAYGPKNLTAFETAMVARIRAQGPNAVIHEDRKIPNWDGGRALVCDKANALVYNCEVDLAKYAVTVYGASGEVLIKNLRVGKRLSSSSIFGSGIILDGTNTGRTPSSGNLYGSNLWIDLDQEMLGDYKVNNSEALCGEIGNKRFNVRESILMRGGEAAIDSKTPISADGCFILGHRALRNWFGDWTLANCIVLIPANGQHYWTCGGSKLSYYNCKFGIMGQKYSELKDTLPPEWTNVVNGVSTEDNKPAVITKLTSDPFDRSASSFWQPAALQIPEGSFLVDDRVVTPPAPPIPPPAPPPPPPAPPVVPPPPPPPPPVVEDADWVALKAIINRIVK